MKGNAALKRIYSAILCLAITAAAGFNGITAGAASDSSTVNFSGYTSDKETNNTTYGPLLEYYFNSSYSNHQYEVVKPGDAYGDLAVWAVGQFGWIDYRNPGHTLYDRIGTMSPKDSNGNLVSMKNSHIRINGIRVGSGDKSLRGAIWVGLRQQTPGKFIDGSYDFNKDQIFVRVSNTGITVASGEELDKLSGSAENASVEDYKFADATRTYITTDGNQFKLDITLVGNNCHVRVFGQSSNSFDESYDEIVSDSAPSAGYLTFGFGDTGSYGLYESIVHKLDDSGQTVEFIGEEQNEYETVIDLKTLNDEGKLNSVGRSGFVGDDFRMDWSNAGFEVNGNLSGDLVMVASRSDLFWMADKDPKLDGCYVNVIIDGEPTRVKVPKGLNSVKLADGLEKGKHTVRVLGSNSAAFGSLAVKRIKFTGTLDAAKSNNRKLHILALGDSITAGYGIYGLSGDSSLGKYEQEIKQSDGYKAYAAVAARRLDAELSVVAYDGAWTEMVHGLANELTRDTAGPDWDWSKDTNDVIVINLGTNDVGSERPDPLNSAKALLDDMRTKNPNAEIIWVYGMMKSDNKDVYEQAVQYMADKGDNKVHFVLMDKGVNDGLGAHPNEEDHAKYGKQLAEYISSLVEVNKYAYHTEEIKNLSDAGELYAEGRNKWSGTSLVSNKGAAGFTVKGEICDDVVLRLNETGRAVRLAVIVDGDTESMKVIDVGVGEQTITVAENLSRGSHTVSVRRATNHWGTTEFKAISYNGTLSKAEPQKLSIEFIGDSITVGDGMLGGNGKEHDYVLDQNSMLGYASKTSARLGADFTMVAVSGIKTAGMIDYYAETNSEYSVGGEKKDIVVINLGTNDVGLWGLTWDEAELRSSVGELLDAVVERNGEDVCIVWAYGMLYPTNKKLLEDMVTSQTNGRNIWFCDLSAAQDNTGWSEHPSQVGNDKATDILTEFITENCLSKIANGDVNNDGKTDILDLICYKKYLSGMKTKFEAKRGDLNSDGEFDTLDMAALRKNILGIK